MRAIITRQNEDGSFDDVGMSNRTCVLDLKTQRGIINRARQYSQNKPFRIEFFNGDSIYGKVDYTLYGDADGIIRRHVQGQGNRISPQ